MLDYHVFNLEEVRQALGEAPELGFRYVGGELKRAQNRVRRKFVKDRMSGPPGIRGGEWRRQYTRHIRATVEGSDLGSLTARLRLSRFLALHETGGVLMAHNKGADMLRLPIGDRRGLDFRGVRFQREAGTGRLRGLIFIRRGALPPLLAEKVGEQLIPRFVLKGRVTIKPKLGFRENVLAHWPAEFPMLRQALGRAMRVAFERRVKAVASMVQQAANF